jgi:putative transposase
MSNYRRNRVPGGTYFFTVNLQNRKQTLLVDHIDVLRDAIRKTRRQRPFHIDGWVVLPEHMHCIWTLPKNDMDYSGRWRAIKKAFSKAIPNTETRSINRERRGERGIWQQRFWEHTIRDDVDYQRHMDYLHFNPVKHGWVTAVKDWPHSTFHHWVKQGIYPEHWGHDIDLNTGEHK